jgi:hypothetical protein
MEVFIRVLISFIPLLFFGALIYWIVRKGSPNRKETIESVDKATEANNRLAEAVNRLADVIEKK